MGKILYDAYLEIELDDRVLVHLQLAMSIKLRRREGFFFSWQKPPGSGEGRTAIWIDASIPLQFVYYGGRMPAINREWVDALRVSSNSAGGMSIIAEESLPEVATPAEAMVKDKLARSTEATHVHPQ
jgi:hypothetical protein